MWEFDITQSLVIGAIEENFVGSVGVALHLSRV